MKRALPFLIIAAVLVAAVLVAWNLKQSAVETPVAAPTPNPSHSATPAKAAEPGADPPHALGDAKAPVTLEEFGDFQCPPCGQFAVFVEELLREYDSRLRVVFRNFPLPAHENAREAALAAEAAGFQGKFWEMHDTLYREQSSWSKAPNARELFESYAGTLGLNMDQFKKDMDSDKVKQKVDSDRALGDSLGIKVTPMLFINNRPLEPQQKNPEGIRAAINAALNEKTQS